MAEHHVIVEHRHHHSYPNDSDLGLLRSQHTPRLSRRQLILVLTLGGICLISLYAYWDVMMLTAGATANSFAAPISAARQRNNMNETLAQQLEREVRVLCWVLTTPKYHKSRAVHIQRTWGKRCNKIYFMTSAPDDELETVILSKPDKYEVLWGKTKEAFTYLYENKFDEADWFMKADDDTYVFVENLRYMLYPYSPDMALHFGFNYKLIGNPPKNGSYMSGGSGYILSREALRIFATGVNDSSKCRQQDDQAEDLEMGICLFNLGVQSGDSRDASLRFRFLPMAPFSLLLSHYYGMDFWFFKYAYYNPRACMNCLSDYPVAFHYISSNELYVYDYFNYQLQVYGRTELTEYLPPKILPEQLQSFIRPSDNV
ncbi:glycoprotein-N-acetylgalactosamine 3-beta-galactosyltransferase 1 [Drosophila tropicalis]|uniref:glycoprotein-N-acetylgalactosamine 3-beta-galactosyltransferase 1 n=1 Tax=Drosophila tropicalis TaxID=46794 RepID=UPI0035ABED27